jgi:hypothetical protein
VCQPSINIAFDPKLMPELYLVPYYESVAGEQKCRSKLSKLFGASPNVFRMVASAKLPMFGSPERLNASAPAFAGSRDMASAFRTASSALWHS